VANRVENVEASVEVVSEVLADAVAVAQVLEVAFWVTEIWVDRRARAEIRLSAYSVYSLFSTLIKIGPTSSTYLAKYKKTSQL